MKLNLENLANMDSFFTPLNDVKTGYTPTTNDDESFKDFSCLENLDTPIPMKTNDCFAFPEQTELFDQLSTAEDQNGCKIDSLVYQLIGKEDDTDDPRVDKRKASVCMSFDDFNDKNATSQHESNPTYYSNYPLAYTNLQPIQSLSRPCLAHEVDHYQFPTTVPTVQNDGSLLTFNTLRQDQRQQYSSLKPLKIDNHIGSCNESALNQRRRNFPKTMVAQTQTGSLWFNNMKTINCVKLEGEMTVSSEQKNKEKQFSCNAPACEKRFARIDELKRHQRTHSDQRPYTCSTCNKGFTRSDHLITHRRTHTGEKPYQCEHCQRRFARSDERSRHVKTHINPKPQSIRGRKKNKQSEQETSSLPIVFRSNATDNFRTF